MEVAVAGSSGLIGSALVGSMQADGHRVVAIVRRAVQPGEDAIRWDPRSRRVDRASLEGLDAVVNLAGAGLGDHRWTPDHRSLVLTSRTRTTSLLASTLAGLERPPAVLVNGSAIGFYGDRGDEILTERSGPGASFLADVVVHWEAAAQPAVDAGIRVAFARTSIVLASHGGALAQLLPLFRLGLGGKMGSGRQWWSWISLADEVRAIRFLVEGDLSGPVNLTTPGAVRNKEMAKALGRVLGRPAVLAVPKLAPRLLKGRELADELLFSSQHVLPTALEAAGFAFEHPTLEPALRSVLDKPA